jgi:hypothetical protein
VPSYRTSFIQSGGFSAFVHLFLRCNDPALLAPLSWLLLYFASPDSLCEDIHPPETTKMLLEITRAIGQLHRAGLWIEFTSVLRWLLEWKRIARALFETSYFPDTIDLLPFVLNQTLKIEDSTAVLITISKIIKYADIAFSITTIPFDDTVIPLLNCGVPPIIVRVWRVLTAAICREPRWIIPELVRLEVFDGMEERMAELGFEVKSAAVECASCAIRSASASEWEAFVGEMGLLTVVLENFDPAEIRGAGFIDAICERAVMENEWKKVIGPFQAVLQELSDTCVDNEIECQGVDEVLRLLGEDNGEK